MTVNPSTGRNSKQSSGSNASCLTSTTHLSSSGSMPSAAKLSRLIRSDVHHSSNQQQLVDSDREDEYDLLHADHRYSRCQKTFNQEFYETVDDDGVFDDDADECNDDEDDDDEDDDEGYDDFFDPFAVRSLLPDSMFFDEILNTNSPFL